MHTFHIVWTLSMLIIFLAIILWAFSKHRKSDFEEASRLPLETDESERIPTTLQAGKTTAKTNGINRQGLNQ